MSEIGGFFLFLLLQIQQINIISSKMSLSRVSSILRRCYIFHLEDITQLSDDGDTGISFSFSLPVSYLFWLGLGDRILTMKIAIFGNRLQPYEFTLVFSQNCRGYCDGDSGFKEYHWYVNSEEKEE